MILLSLAVATFAGVLLASLGASDAWPALAIIAGGAGMGLLLSGRRQHGLLLLMACLACGLGLARYDVAQPVRLANSIGALNGQPVVFQGYVAKEPEQRGSHQRFTVRVDQLLSDQEWQPASGDVLVSAPPYPDLAYGQRLQLEARLQEPPTFPDFDYREYLERRGIVSLANWPSIQVLPGLDGNVIRRYLEDSRRQLGDSLAMLLPEPESSLARGMLLGQRASIPDDLYEDFNRAGISHLVVISGSNVMLLAALSTGAFAWLLGRQRAILVSALLIFVFAVFVGGSPPVLRATAMALVVLGAQLAGRPNSALSALLFTAAVLLLWQPLLIHDVAFQLSLAATTGIVVASRRFQELLLGLISAIAPVTLARPVTESLAMTATASLAVLPVTTYHFGAVSLIALPANLFAGLLFTPILALSAVAALIGSLSIDLAQPAADLAYLPLHLFVVAGENLGSVSWASLQLDSFGALSALGLAVVVTIALLFLSQLPAPEPSEARGLRVTWVQALTLIVLITAVWSFSSEASEAKPAGLQVTFLDVGQGDATLIETPGGMRILIDGGPDGARLMQELADALPQGSRHIDLLVLTHAQADHVTGLVSVLQRFDVDAVLESGIGSEIEAYAAWRQEIERQQLPVIQAQSGMMARLDDGVTIEVMAPTELRLSNTEDDLNNNSLVLRVSLGELSFLFTGDIEAEAEEALLQRGEIEADVLKVAHHGSESSSTATFLQAVGADLAVISAGEDNTFGHPSPSAMLRLGGTPFLRTDLNGTVTVETDGTSLWTRYESGSTRLVPADLISSQPSP